MNRRRFDGCLTLCLSGGCIPLCRLPSAFGDPARPALAPGPQALQPLALLSRLVLMSSPAGQQFLNQFVQVGWLSGATEPRVHTHTHICSAAPYPARHLTRTPAPLPLPQAGGMHPELMQRLLRDSNPVAVLVDGLVIASHLARLAKEGEHWCLCV